jgi:hypothetical protein
MGKASRQRRQKKEHEREPQQAGPRHQGTPRAEPSLKEQAAALITKAALALVGHQHAAYERHLDQLSAERTPGWSQVVSRSAVDFLRLAVATAWRAGWQPAELARHVGREGGAAHSAMIADIIADEARDYPAPTLDPRWAAQVKALIETGSFGIGQKSDGIWWGTSAEYLGAWRAAVRDPDPTSAVRVAVEALAVLQHLPVLEKLLPLPGTARPAPARSATSPAPSGHADERMLSKIRALLAKAESTEFSEEAEALSARAQELMAKYSIDQALLAAQAGEKDAPSGRRIAVDNPYEAAKASLLNVVADANRCRAIWAKNLGLVTVVGFPADLDAVELLFTSMLVQANTAMLRAGGKKDEFGRSRTRAFRQSFLVSYALRIGERLAEAASHAVDEAVAERESAWAPAAKPAAGTDLVPFLAARREEVDDAVDEMFGDKLTRGRSVRVTDAEGWASGRAAADLASLHHREGVAG